MNKAERFWKSKYRLVQTANKQTKLLGDAIALSKVEWNTIDAIAQAMWRRAIWKHMTQMTLAMAAEQLNASHSVFEVFLRLDGALVNDIEEAGPTASALELRGAVK